AEKGTDCGEKFQIPPTHCLPRDVQLAHDASDAIDFVETKAFLLDLKQVVVQLESWVLENAVVDLRLGAMHHHQIGLACEVVAPKSALIAHHQLGIVTLAHPAKGSRRVQPDPLFPEGFLSSLQHEPEKNVTQ